MQCDRIEHSNAGEEETKTKPKMKISFLIGGFTHVRQPSTDLADIVSSSLIPNQCFQPTDWRNAFALHAFSAIFEAIANHFICIFAVCDVRSTKIQFENKLNELMNRKIF